MPDVYVKIGEENEILLKERQFFPDIITISRLRLPLLLRMVGSKRATQEF